MRTSTRRPSASAPRFSSLGLAPGDRAPFQMGTVIDTAIAPFGCFKAGLVPVCTLPQHREIEMGELARRSEATAYFVQADFSAFDLPGFAARLASDHPSIREIIVARGVAGSRARGFDALIESVSLAQARTRLAGVTIGTEDVLTFQLSGGTTGVPKIIPRFHAEYSGLRARLGAPAAHERARGPALRAPSSTTPGRSRASSPRW